MTLYMLDTNIVSHVIRGDLPAVRLRLASVPKVDIVISAVTEAELRYGVAKRGHPARLASEVDDFLSQFRVVPWTSLVARVYGGLRVMRERVGKPLGPLDMLIAAHALALCAMLVTRHASFALLSCGISLEDWTSMP